MGRVAVIGEGTAVAGYALAGALVVPAEDAEAVRSAWEHLPDDVDVVVLTAAAGRILGPDCDTTRPPFAVVMPG